MKRAITLLLILCFGFSYSQTYYPIFQTPTVTANTPLEMTFGYSRHAGLYNKNLMVRSGTITGMAWAVESAAGGTFPIKIYLENAIYNEFGGVANWATYTSNATLVYDGNIILNTGGWRGVTFDTPFVYDITKNIVVYVEYNFGGTGSGTTTSFSCKEIDSSIEWHSMLWYSNNTPPSGNGILLNSLPNILFLFESLNVDPPASVSSSPECNSNIVSWSNNSSNDSIMIAYNFTGNFSNPTNGSNYAVGSVVVNDSVIFLGKASDFSHSGILLGQNYKYRVWHKSIFREYSSPLNTSVTSASNLPKFYNFDGGIDIPVGWTGSMTNEPGHGFEDNGLTYALSSTNPSTNAITTNFCNVTSTTTLSFKYRLVNVASYPANATAPSDLENIVVSVSTNNGQTWNSVHTISSANHIQSTQFATITVPLGTFDGEMIKIRFSCTRSAGNFHFDLDDVNITNLTSIGEHQSLPISVYPNPAHDMIQVELNLIDDKQADIVFFDLQGKLVFQTSVTGNIHMLNISSIPSGMYIIKIQTENRIGYSRFIKQ